MDNIISLHRETEGQKSFTYHFDLYKIMEAVKSLSESEDESVKEMVRFVDFILTKYEEVGQD